MQAKTWLILHNKQLTSNPSLPPRPVKLISQVVEKQDNMTKVEAKTSNGSKN